MDVIQLISNLGFPIFAFLVTGLACKYVYDKETSRLDVSNDRINELTAAVNHNSEAILRLCDKMDREESKDDGR